LHATVVIVGGGPAGVSTAIHVARTDITAIILDSETKTNVPGESVNAATRLALEQLGIHQSLDITVTSYGIESSWGSNTPVCYSTITDPLGNGWHLDRRAMHASLLAAATKRTGVDVHREGCESVRRKGSKWIISTKTKMITCDVLVDATGRSGIVARSLGARRQQTDSLQAVSGIFENVPTFGMLRVQAAPYGWWYLAPLPGARALASLMSDHDIIRQTGAARLNHWLTLFGHTSLEHTVATGSPPLTLGVHPCETSIVNPIVGERWLAVGDAAAVVDPLSNFGVLKALDAGRRGAEAIAQDLRGDTDALERYAKAQEQDFRDYLQARAKQYQMESRWRREPFWQRRAA